MPLLRVALALACLATAGASLSQTEHSGFRCWGPPEGARPLGRADDRRFEIRDELPGPPSSRAGEPDRAGGGPGAPLIAPDRPFSRSFWVPLASPDEPETYILRSIPYRQVVTTPRGTFDLTVAPIRAVRKGTRDDGLLVCLGFDPAVQGRAAYPLPEAFGTARRLSLLTARQRHVLADLDRVVDSRTRGLEWAWNEFAQSPCRPESRRRLLDLVFGFHNPQPAAAAEALAPERFFDRAQRVRLRSEGLDVPGRCSFWAGAGRATIQLEACPLSQIARTWNHLARERGGPFLEASGPAGFEEVDSLELESTGLAEDAARRLVLGTLTSIPGMAVRPKPPGPP